MSKLCSHSSQPITAEENELYTVATKALEMAVSEGCTAADLSVDMVDGLSYSVRHGEPETLEKNQDKGLDIRVFMGDQTGVASTTDFSDIAIQRTVKAATAIASVTQGDPCLRLADVSLYPTELSDLDSHHPQNWQADQAAEFAREQAASCEGAALADSRISNTEGASFNAHQGVSLVMNSNGFSGFTRSTRYGLSCSVIAGERDAMQRDFWYDSKRCLDDLDSAVSIGERAARRTLSRLGSRKIKTQQVPVLYDAPVASSLISHFISAINGRAIHKKATFLVDQLDQAVFPDFVQIHQQPHLRRAVGSAHYDADCVATRPLAYIENGVLKSYVLSHYSACKLGLTTTGNAGGVRNLIVDPSSQGELNQSDLLKEMGTGLLVTEMMGFGINGVTGDYSRGAAGFWVENGEIQYPVEEITLSGNLKSMFQNLVAIGSDVDSRGNTRVGSILIDHMMIGGL